MANSNGQRRLITFVALFVAGLAIGAGLMYFLDRPTPEQQRARTESQRTTANRVTARGRLEPEGGVINLAASAPDILKKLLVREGDTVQQGQELANLASRTVRDIEWDLAKLQLQEAEDRRKKVLEHLTAQQKESDAKIRQLETQGPIEVEVQEAKVRVLERQLNTAESLLTRMRRAGSYPQQEIDQQELQRLQAEQELTSARAILAKMKEANSVNLEVARAQRESNVAGLRRAESEIPLGSLQKGIQLAVEKLDLTVIRAPTKGKVLKILAHEGEPVGNQPVFQIGDTSSIIAVTEVYETDIKAVREWVRDNPRVEADVEIRFPNAGVSKFRGQVTHVADLVSRNTTFSVDPRQEVDRRVVEVRIRLDPAHQREASEYINMQVDVTIFDPKAPKSE